MEEQKDVLIEVCKIYKDEEDVFRGFLNDRNFIGKWNFGKKNPKEPDLRLYYEDLNGGWEKQDFLSLWLKKSTTGREYFIGNRDGITYIGLIRFNRMSEEEPFIILNYVIKIRRDY